jgi:hypothetical protein
VLSRRCLEGAEQLITQLAVVTPVTDEFSALFIE